MTRIKKLTLSALNPVGTGLEQAWSQARLKAWFCIGNTLKFDPDAAVDAMRENLGGLVRSGILAHWEVELEEGWLRNDVTLVVKYEYGQGGRKGAGTERFKVR